VDSRLRGNERMRGNAFNIRSPPRIEPRPNAECGTPSIPLIPAKAGIQNDFLAFPCCSGFPHRRAKARHPSDGYARE